MKIINMIEYKPTIDELAEEIWNLDSEEQLNLLSKLRDVYSIYRILMQMQHMRDIVMNNKDNNNYRNAKDFVRCLNDYLNGGNEI